MASHDDLVLIINQLLKSMDRMGESVSVVKSIGEDVKAIAEEVHLIKHRLDKIEEIVCSDLLPKKYEVFTTEAENPPIRFDSTKKGRCVRVTNNGMCAERITPLDNGLYGGVISNLPLREEQLFEMTIEETIDKWNTYGLSIGVLCEKEEAEVQGAKSIFYEIKGTWAIHSYKDSTSGKSETWKDTNRITFNGYPLDTRLLKREEEEGVPPALRASPSSPEDADMNRLHQDVYASSQQSMYYSPPQNERSPGSALHPPSV